MLEVTDATFQTEVLESPIPVLVDFWAPWCGPCKAIAPAFEKLATEFDGKVKFVKLNTQSNAAIASSLGITALPTFILFKDGRPVQKMVGTGGGPTALRKLATV